MRTSRAGIELGRSFRLPAVDTPVDANAEFSGEIQNSASALGRWRQIVQEAAIEPSRISAKQHGSMAGDLRMCGSVTTCYFRQISGQTKRLPLDPIRQFLFCLEAAVVNLKSESPWQPPSGLGGLRNTFATVAHLVDFATRSLSGAETGFLGRALHSMCSPQSLSHTDDWV